MRTLTPTCDIPTQNQDGSSCQPSSEVDIQSHLVLQVLKWSYQYLNVTSQFYKTSNNPRCQASGLLREIYKRSHYTVDSDDPGSLLVFIVSFHVCVLLNKENAEPGSPSIVKFFAILCLSRGVPFICYVWSPLISFTSLHVYQSTVD